MNAITPFQATNEEIQPRILDHDTISANRHKPNPDPDYIVQHFLFPGQVSIFAGPSNLGKSAIVASIAAHIAMGRDFCGLRVSRSAILYVAAEAAKGVLNRAYPYLHRDAAQAAAFEVLDLAVDLTDPLQARRLAEEAACFRDFHRCDSLLIVFDTLSLCIGEGDENYTRDAARLMANAGLLAKTTNAHVLIVHHVGAAEASRPRGSTAFVANADTAMTLHKADDNQPEGTVFIRVFKQREDRKPEPMAFRIRGFEIGENRHGEMSTIPWAVPFEPSSSLVEQERPKVANKAGPSISQQRAADLLRVLTALSRQDLRKWHKAKSLGEMSGEPFNTIRDNPDTMRKKVKAALDSLAGENKIEVGPEGYRLAPTSIGE